METQQLIFWSLDMTFVVVVVGQVISNHLKNKYSTLSSISFMSVPQTAKDKPHKTEGLKSLKVSLLLPCDLKVLCSESDIAQYIVQKRQ